MRILWLHQYFSTPKGWGAVRTYEFARRFVQAGHAVDVVCCAGYDASLKPTGEKPFVIDGVRVFVSGTAYRPHMGFFRRIWSFLLFMSAALGFVARRGGAYDVMIASSGPLTLAVPALAGRWLRRLPFVFEVIDVWPDSAIAAGVLKNPVLTWLSFKLAAFAYHHAAVIVTCSTGMTERVMRALDAGGRGGAIGNRMSDACGGVTRDLTCGHSKVLTISNCCDLGEFVSDETLRKKTRERYDVRDSQTVVLYAGAMGASNAVDDLLEAIRGTADDDRIVWWIAGDGPRGDEIRALLNVNGHHRFLGSMAKQELAALYLAADVNGVTFMHEPLFYENSPNKFFDGIAAGLPTVFNRSTWLEPWLTEYACGIACPGQAPGREMADAIRELAGDPERRRQMGRNARRLAEDVFDRDALATRYLDVLESALKF